MKLLTLKDAKNQSQKLTMQSMIRVTYTRCPTEGYETTLFKSYEIWIWLSLSCVPWFPGTVYHLLVCKTSLGPWKLGYT